MAKLCRILPAVAQKLVREEVGEKYSGIGVRVSRLGLCRDNLSHYVIDLVRIRAIVACSDLVLTYDLDRGNANNVFREQGTPWRPSQLPNCYLVLLLHSLNGFRGIQT